MSFLSFPAFHPSLHASLPPYVYTLAELLEVSESTASAFSFVAAPITLVVVVVMVRLASTAVEVRGGEGMRKAWVVAAARRRRRKIPGVLLLEVNMPLAAGRREAVCDKVVWCCGCDGAMIKL